MVYVDNSAINQYQGVSYHSDSEDFNLLNLENLSEDLSPEERERLINFFSEAVHTENKD
jgi:hypothetical protein